MKQSTEYWVRTIDENEDTIDIYFYNKQKEARQDKESLLAGDQPEAVDIILSKVTRWYESDGELKDEVEVMLEW